MIWHDLAVPRLIVILGLILGSHVPAGGNVQTYWQYDPNAPGDWFERLHWTDGVPGAQDTAYIDNGGTASISYGYATAYRVRPGYLNSGSIVHTGGNLSILGSDARLQIAFYEGTTGSYTLSGDAELWANQEDIGIYANSFGTFTQTGGLNRTNEVFLGFQNNGRGRYELSGGHLWVTGASAISNAGLKVNGGGTLDQTGGICSATLTAIGYACVGRGEFRMKGGTFEAYHYWVGYYGEGLVVQSAGVSSTNYLYVGLKESHSGEYQLSGGSFTAEREIVGEEGTGVFRQTGGTNTIVGSINGRLELGAEVSGNGRYILSGGSLEIEGRALVGYEGTGVFEVLGDDATASIGRYHQHANGTLVSGVDADGLTLIDVSGEASLSGRWEIVDMGAGLGRFEVLTAAGGLTVGFDSVSLPDGNWSWGVDGNTLWAMHVPEPAALLLLALSGVAVIRRRRRR